MRGGRSVTEVGGGATGLADAHAHADADAGEPDGGKRRRASDREGGAKRKGASGAGGVEMALDPSELEHLDEAALKARYERMQAAQREASAPEDVSDIIEEQERKRKRKLEQQRAADKKGGR